MIAPNTLFPPDINQDDFADTSEQVFGRAIERGYSRVLRRLHEFSEQEVRLPTGPRRGLMFNLDTQPFVRLLWSEFDNPYWYQAAITGCTQTGKSLSAFALPILHTLFEKGEDAIAAAPTMDIIEDKVRRDFKPVVKASSFADQWPTTGGGARTGVPGMIEFRNGATLKLMSFSGGDKSKASYTASNIFFTEIDGEKPSQTSAEANALEQIIARARSESLAKRWIVMECTVSYERAPIWHFYSRVGSGTRLALPCPYCDHWVSPEREHLKGWQDAKSEIEAEQRGAWHCPNCDHPWTEEERYQVNQDAKLVHKTQTIDKRGRISGPMPETRTLGFRFAAVNSMFLKASDIAMDCWEAERSRDEEDAEKKLCQFVFCQPYVPLALVELELDPDKMQSRMAEFVPKGVVPMGTHCITVGMDVGIHRCHWVAIAWVMTDEARRGVVIDYGEIKLEMMVDGKKLTGKVAGLDQMWQMIIDPWLWGNTKGGVKGLARGWPTQNGEIKTFDKLWIDSRWQGDEDVNVVDDAIKAWGDPRILPIQGFGSDKKYGNYNPPRKNPRTGLYPSGIKRVGYHYHIFHDVKAGLYRAAIHVDKWKHTVQKCMHLDKQQVGALVLYESKTTNEHQKYAKHLAAERLVEDFDPKKGMVKQMVRESSANHFLDASGYAFAAGYDAGFRTSTRKFRTAPKAAPQPNRGIRGRGGKSFVARKR